MADANAPKNAAAPEILAALKALQADLAAARSQLATLERQVVAARPAAAAGAGRAVEGAARGEAEMAGLLQKEREFIGLREREGTINKTIAEGEQKRVATQGRTTAVLREELALQERLAIVSRQAAGLPAGQRAGFVAHQAQYAPILAGAQPQQVRAATSAAFTADAPQRIAQTRAEVERLSVTEGAYIERTRTAGAMSGDFISRLAHGRVTLSEFGSNLGQTAGKFAGWTAAAAGVGALVGVAIDLGRGARDSSSGVNQLARSVDNVSPEKAQAGFRQLSRETNLSIKEVSDAQFQFARTFDTQQGSLEAARVGLRAYRLDNVNVADSVRAFTAVHNQFGVEASGLLPLFDKLDEGQRKFNARVSESLPALTRSAAGVKNAGGDLNELVKIIVYGVRVTGQSGNVLGNALSRSATNFVPKIKNAAELKKLGFDPTQAYTQLLSEAIHRAADMTGEQRRQLANALGGPQLGSRVFAPLLGGPKGAFDKVSTGLDEASGSSGKEMTDLLNRTDEQLHKIGKTIERIGSALNQAGAFDAFGVGLHILNDLLGGVEKLLNLYDRLPASIKPWITALLEARGILFVLQRTRIGAGLAGATGITALGPSPQRQAIKAQTETLGRNAAGLETAASQAQVNARVARQEQLTQQQLAIERGIAGDKAAQNALEAEANASAERSLTQERTATALMREATALRAEMLAITRGEVAVNEEIVVAQRAAIAGLAPAVAGNLVAAGGAGALAAGGRGAGALEEAALLSGGGKAARAAALEKELAGAGSKGLPGLLEKGGAKLEGGARGLLTSGKQFGKFASGMGVFNVALLTYFAASPVFDKIKEQTKALDKQNKDYESSITTLGGLKAERQKALKQHDLGVIGGTADDLLHGFGLFGETTTTSEKNAGNARKQQIDTIIRARRHTLNAPIKIGFSYDELLAEEKKNVTAFAEGHISYQTFVKRYNNILASIQQSMGALTGDSKGVNDTLKKATDMFYGAFNKAPALSKDPFSQFRHASLSQDVNLLEKVNARTKIRGTNQTDFDTIIRGIAFVQSKYGRTDSKKQLEKIDQAYGSLDTFISTQNDEFQAILSTVKRTGDRIPASAITPTVALTQLGTQAGGTDRAYGQYIDKLQNERAQIPKTLQALRDGLTKDQRSLAKAQAKYHGERGLTSGGMDVPGLGHIPDLAQNIPGLGPVPNLLQPDTALADRIQRLKDKIKRDRKGLKDATGALSKRDQKIVDEINKAQEEQYSYDSGIIDLRSQYAQATAADKSDAIAQKIKYDGQQVKLALQYHGPDRWAKIIQALTTQANDIAAKAQQHLADVQLNAQVATSGITGVGPAADRARLQSQLTGANQALAAARAEPPNPNRKDDIKNAIIQRNNVIQQINANVHQQAQQAHQDALAYHDSLTAIAVARAGDDPVKRDRAQLRGDLYDLHHLKRSDFQSTAEYRTARNQALAKVITDRKQVVTDTASQDLQNAQFEHQIGKLTDDQYIAKLKQILKLKGLSKQMRQQLLLEIYQSEHANESDLSLNLGDIKLPSSYQIVRGLRKRLGAHAAVSQAQGALLKTENHNTFNFNIHGGKPKEVAAAVGEALDTATGGSALANLRAAGAI
jgi:hypothetical protein